MVEYEDQLGRRGSAALRRPALGAKRDGDQQGSRQPRQQCSLWPRSRLECERDNDFYQAAGCFKTETAQIACDLDRQLTLISGSRVRVLVDRQLIKSRIL